MASKGSGRAKSSKGRRLARASKRGTRYSLRSAHPLQNDQALESKSIVSSQANASGGLDSRELQDSQHFMESKAGHGLQDSKNAYKSQKNQGITESSMQLESGDAQGIANDKELQNPPCAPTYTESKIKSSPRVGLESKIPQSIQASQDNQSNMQDKDPKKEQSKNEDLQNTAARKGERDQKIQAIQVALESNAKLDFQESNPTKTFIKPSPSHGGLQNLQVTCNPCKSQEGKSAIESKMQLKSEDLKNITTEEKSYQKNQATSCAPTYTESNIKSSPRARLESKIPQSIQASQDKDSKKEQLKNEDLQNIAARKGEKDQTGHPTQAQAIMESKTKSSLDFQTIQSPQTSMTYTESKESQMQIPFEILGFDSV